MSDGPHGGLLAPDSVLVERLTPSPNHGARLNGAAADAIVLHYTGMADAASALARLTDAASGVSCHYVVDEMGSVAQIVAESRRAWHAGRSSWRGETDMNSASVGIEIVNGGHDFGLPPFPDRQIASVTALCLDIAARLAIPPERVLAHSDIAPGRKRDPGERFPWARLSRSGVGHWAESAADLAGADEGVKALRCRLAQYGYAVDPTGGPDAALATVVAAFQRHFRPSRVDGVADAETSAMLRALIAGLPW